MATRAMVDLAQTSTFELEALEALPCGCVASAHRSRFLDVILVSLEAKGPYCPLPGHLAGQTLRLADLPDEEPEADLLENRP